MDDTKGIQVCVSFSVSREGTLKTLVKNHIFRFSEFKKHCLFGKVKTENLNMVFMKYSFSDIKTPEM